MLNKYFKSDFIKHFSYLFGASILSQIIPFLVLPILQKYFFDAEDFGVYTLYLSISELLIALSTLKYEYAILQDKKIKYSVNTLYLSILTSVSISILVFISIILIYNCSSFNELGVYLLLVPISVFSIGIYESINYWFNKQKQFLSIGIFKLTNSTAAESSKVSLGYLNYGINGLILGKIIGQIVVMLVSIGVFLKKYKNHIKFFNFKIIKQQAVKHRKFPLFTAPGVIITSVINYMYIRLFYEFYGADKVGVIGISTSYIAAVFALISSSFSQIFFQKISYIHDIKKLKELYINYSKILSIFSIIVLSVTFIFPEKALVYILGDKWKGLLPVIQIMCTWLSVSFITSSLSFIYIRLNKQKTMFLLEILHLVLVCCSISVSYIMFNNFKISLISFAASQIIYYTIVYVVSLQFMKEKS